VKRPFFLALLAVSDCAPGVLRQKVLKKRFSGRKSKFLAKAFEAGRSGVDRNIDGVLGVDILDLDRSALFAHADEVSRPAPSKIV